MPEVSEEDLAYVQGYLDAYRIFTTENEELFPEDKEQHEHPMGITRGMGMALRMLGLNEEEDDAST